MDVEFSQVVYPNDQSWEGERRSTLSAFSPSQNNTLSSAALSVSQNFKEKKLEQNEVAMNQPHLLEATDPKELVGHP